MPADYSSQPIPMQVMVTGASTIKEQIANLIGAVEKLTKTVEEKDLQMAELYRGPRTMIKTMMTR